MMSAASIFGVCAAALMGIGLYGLLVQPSLLRKVLSFNLVGSGIFLLFGSIAARDPGAGSDPVPQAMAITGIVVALSITALGLGLVWRYRSETGRTTLPEEHGD